MKIFHCNFCGNVLFFESISCLKCGHTLGFLPFPKGEMAALEKGDNAVWRKAGGANESDTYRQCANTTEHKVCNWMIPAECPDPYCGSCRLNEMIPDLSVSGNLWRWHKLEMAKRRLVYALNRLRLPLSAVPGENRPALRFKFIADIPGGPPAPTGHLNGLITINIVEADDPERERRRVNLHEPYRTLLGHLRHEVAHYFWDRLIDRSRWLDRCRQLFGDDRMDYSAALKRHYNEGPPADWQQNFISAYATMHPWEDWAETWAHYFHIIDLVETATAFGLTIKPDPAEKPTVMPAAPPRREPGFEKLLEAWFPLTQVLNSLNRSMGMPDAYPFALSDKAVEKLHFIHEVVMGSAEA